MPNPLLMSILESTKGDRNSVTLHYNIHYGPLVSVPEVPNQGAHAFLGNQNKTFIRPL